MVSKARQRDYEAATTIITSRLNMPHPSAAVRRVTALLIFLHDASKRAQLEGIERLQTFLKSPVLRETINRKLMRYSNWTPQFLAQGRQPVAVWSRKAAEKLNAEDGPENPWELIDSEDWADPKEFEEMAVWFLLAKGHWERYRRCDQCPQWFYALTDFQKFCQKSCRQKAAAQTDEFKEKRKIYMKERYRPNLKARTEKGLELSARRKKR